MICYSNLYLTISLGSTIPHTQQTTTVLVTAQLSTPSSLEEQPVNTPPPAAGRSWEFASFQMFGRIEDLKIEHLTFSIHSVVPLTSSNPYKLSVKRVLRKCQDLCCICMKNWPLKPMVPNPQYQHSLAHKHAQTSPPPLTSLPWSWLLTG